MKNARNFLQKLKIPYKAIFITRKRNYTSLTLVVTSGGARDQLKRAACTKSGETRSSPGGPRLEKTTRPVVCLHEYNDREMKKKKKKKKKKKTAGLT